MTNETTASQPKVASIGDDAQFRELLSVWYRGNSGASRPQKVERDLAALIELIDSRAPAAQASATIQAAPEERTIEYRNWVEFAKGVISELANWSPSNRNPLDVLSELRARCKVWDGFTPAATIQEPVMVAEPVGVALEYQFRTRADWHKHWSGWDRCTKEQHDEKLAKPLVHDWHYEVRALGVIGAAPMVADPAGVAVERHAIADALALWLSASMDQHAATDEMRTHIRAWLDFRDFATVKAVPSEALERVDRNAVIAECILACEAEKVEAEITDEPTDHSYNLAIKHCIITLTGMKIAAPLAYKTGGGE